MLKTIFFIYSIFIATSCFAQEEPNYDFSRIPAELLKNADAVVRDHHTEIHIDALDDIHVTEHYAITILNEKGNEYGRLEESYGKFEKIEDINGKLYDKYGKEIRKLKSKDIGDRAVYDGVTFFNDYRYKYFDFGYSQYPYTCEYEVETKYKMSFFLPSWAPQPGINCAVEHAEINILYPKDLSIRYRTFHIDSMPAEKDTDDVKQITLSVSNIHSKHKKDKFAPNEYSSLPLLLLAPDKFQLEDLHGTMSSWKDLGKFVYDLNSNRDELPEATKRIVHQLTDTCHSVNEKIDILYDYLKKNTRYLAINLGIGGWQTFEASFVAENGYGDCKALSNYMKSLLKEAGVTSYQALINGDADNSYTVQEDFPLNRFNHVILCVPQNNDTTWVECTTKTLPAGYLSSFTSNRDALLLTPDGGKLIRTPDYTSKENILKRSASIHINSSDELNGDLNLSYEGYFWDAEDRHISDNSQADIEKHLNGEFILPSYEVTNYKISNGKVGQIPELTEKVTLKGSPILNRSGKRVFLSTDIFPLKTEEPTSYDERKTPFQLKKSYQIVDTITINIDGSYTSEYLPEDVKMSYPFAYYESKIVFENNNVIKLIRSYNQKEGVYPAKLFSDYITLSNAMNSASEKNKVVLINKE
ncbi:MAG TPA: DUF3857 domain-containing protein [Flavipsychrobacter sp.]|nr:DUF3857 domain-containing protein [Flavipsychrobacter sp.]